MAYSLSDIRDALAGLNGESTTPTDASRDRHIQRAVEDIWYRAYWSWRRKTSDVAFNSSGVSTTDLSAYLSQDSFPIPSRDSNAPRGEARLVVSGDGNDQFYRIVNKEDRDDYVAGDQVIWYDGNPVDGYTFNIKETTSPTLSVTYFVRHDVLSSSSDVTRIPLVTPVAAGAFVYLARSVDENRDVRKESGLYAGELNRLYSMENSNRSNRLVGPSEAAGHYLGQP